MNVMTIKKSGPSLAIAAASLIFLTLPAAFAADSDQISGSPSMQAEGPDSAQTVDDRIKDLHDRLMITSDQESLWKDVADVMRGNAEDMKAKIQERADSASSMTAVDDIKSFQAITQAHADDLMKFEKVFAPLYAAMSPEQQKNADSLFGHRAEEDAKKIK